MKAKRVDCLNCKNILLNHKDMNYACDLGKRVLYRKPISPYSNDFIFPRYCNDYKQIET